MAIDPLQPLARCLVATALDAPFELRDFEQVAGRAEADHAWRVATALQAHYRMPPQTQVAFILEWEEHKSLSAVYSQAQPRWG